MWRGGVRSVLFKDAVNYEHDIAPAVDESNMSKVAGKVILRENRAAQRNSMSWSLRSAYIPHELA